MHAARDFNSETTQAIFFDTDNARLFVAMAVNNSGSLSHDFEDLRFVNIHGTARQSVVHNTL